METTPIHEFTSHIAGKNAKVRIYRDRVEWEVARGLSVGKLTAGVATAGASLLVTGVKNGRAGTEMIPLRSVTSVTSRRDGFLNTLVSVVTSGNTIDFRVSHSEAAQVRQVLNGLILGGDAAPAADLPLPAAPAAPVDAAAQILRFAELHRAGVLTDEEFSAKKAQLLST